MSRRGPERAAVLGTTALALAAGVLMALVLAASGAAAATGATSQLCTPAAPTTCSVQAPPELSDASTIAVAVTGATQTRVAVGAYRLIEGETTSFELLAGPFSVTTDDNGFAQADLLVPRLPNGTPGGPVLFTVGDPSSKPLDRILGTWSLLRTRTPVVLGDGFRAQKPVGEPLEIHLDAVARNASFDVELRGGGSWNSIGLDPGKPCLQARCAVTYAVPRGLPDRVHDVRLVDLESGVPVAVWQVRPSPQGVREAVRSLVVPPVGAAVPHAVSHARGATSNPVPQPRAENLAVPEVAADVIGAGAPTTHPRGWVVHVCAAIALGGLLLALVLVRRSPA